jgi:hypothetical protein
LYDLHKISGLNFYKRESTSFMQQLDNSFWIIGGDTVYFSYNGKTQVLGKQLLSQDAKQLSQVLNKIIDGYKA